MCVHWPAAGSQGWYPGRAVHFPGHRQFLFSPALVQVSPGIFSLLRDLECQCWLGARASSEQKGLEGTINSLPLWLWNEGGSSSHVQRSSLHLHEPGACAQPFLASPCPLLHAHILQQGHCQSLGQHQCSKMCSPSLWCQVPCPPFSPAHRKA